MISDIVPALSSPTMNFPTILGNAGSFPSCKAKIQWLSSSVAEVIAPKTGGRLKDFFNSIASLRLLIAG